LTTLNTKRFRGTCKKRFSCNFVVVAVKVFIVIVVREVVVVVGRKFVQLRQLKERQKQAESRVVGAGVELALVT
jgi:hypothetical protein